MTDIIPAELDFVDGSVQVDGVSTGYSFDNETRTLTVPLDRIAPNTKTTVTFAATVNESAYGKTVYNTAVMSGDNISDTEAQTTVLPSVTVKPAPALRSRRTSPLPRSATRSPIF